MKTSHLLLGASLAFTLLGSDAPAASYFTNFDPPTYTGGATLSGQDGGTGAFWDTNNYSNNGTPNDTSDDLGQSDFVGVVGGYSLPSPPRPGPDYWAFLGGLQFVAPVVNTSYLFVPLDLTGETQTDFSVRFAITSSQTPNTTSDTFGWTFRGSSGNQLLRVEFIPAGTDPATLTIGVFDASNTELAGSGSASISYDSPYDLRVTVSSIGLVSVSIDDPLPAPPVPVVTNRLDAGIIPSAIRDIAATWTVTDTTADANGERSGFGNNALVFDNYSVVPEPSAVSLLLIGAAALCRRPKRGARCR